MKADFLKQGAPTTQQPMIPQRGISDPADMKAMEQDPLGMVEERLGGPGVTNDSGPGNPTQPPVLPTVPIEAPNPELHTHPIYASSGLNCELVEWMPGRWYYLLEDYGSPKGAWDWRENSTAYGPFHSQDEAVDHLQQNHSNPGGWSVAEYEERLHKDEVLQGLIEKAQTGSGRFRTWGSKRAVDNYCDACDRAEANCVCAPHDCDLTRPRRLTGSTGYQDRNPALDDVKGESGRAGRMTAEEAGYMELPGAIKEGDCKKVKVAGGVSFKLGCCNEFERLTDDVRKFSCGTCEYKKEWGTSGKTEKSGASAKTAFEENKPIECPYCKTLHSEEEIDTQVSEFSGAEYGENVYEAGDHTANCSACGGKFSIRTYTKPTYHTSPYPGGEPKSRNTKPIVEAAQAAEETTMAKKSARELLREKVAAHAAEKKALKFGRLREVALKESKKAGEAISELAHSMRVVAESFSHLAANLDLTPPPSAASPAAKAAALKKYAAEFRRLAEQNPEMLSDAVIELYHSLDEICAGVENLASNLGIELPTEEAEVEFTEGEGVPEGLEVEGEELETPEQESLEQESGFEGTEADEVQDEALAKAATGAGGFVTDRDQNAEPKPVEKAEIPRSDGEAKIKASLGLRRRPVPTKAATSRA